MIERQVNHDRLRHRLAYLQQPQRRGMLRSGGVISLYWPSSLAASTTPVDASITVNLAAERPLIGRCRTTYEIFDFEFPPPHGFHRGTGPH
jgi:hypothetical protein